DRARRAERARRRDVAGHGLIARESVSAERRPGCCHTGPIREEEAVAVATHLDVAKYIEALRGRERADAEAAGEVGLTTRHAEDRALVRVRVGPGRNLKEPQPVIRSIGVAA